MDSTQQLVAIVALVIVGLLIATSCERSQTRIQPEQPSANTEDYPKLESRLFELATAKEPEKLAKQYNIDYEDGYVRVVIETQDPTKSEDIIWAVEALGGQLEEMFQELIQASVPVNTLLKLAKHPRVRMIRSPMRPHRGEDSPHAITAGA